jgi:Fe-S-cluster-containing dehydrogenase component
MQLAMLVNLNRCTGCWTCSMACRVAHKLEIDEYWQYIRTIGGNEIDEPGGTWPNLYMKWKPIYTTKCTLCGDRAVKGEEAFCSFNCPTKALTYGDISAPDSAISKRMAELKEKGFVISEASKWEGTHGGIFYAEKP